MKLYHITTARLHGDHEDGDLDEIVVAKTITAAIRKVLGTYFEYDLSDELPRHLSNLDGIPHPPASTDTSAFFTFDMGDSGIQVSARLISETQALEIFNREVESCREHYLVTPKLKLQVSEPASCNLVGRLEN